MPAPPQDAATGQLARVQYFRAWLRYERPHPALPADLRRQWKPDRSGHLSLNYVGSNDQQAILQSPSSSTVAVIGARQAEVSTTFFQPEFTDYLDSTRRIGYLRSRLDALLDALERHQVNRFSLIGAQVEARLSAADVGRDRLVLAATRALDLVGPMSGGREPYDFSVRVAHRATTEEFASIQVDWYQELRIQVAIGTGLPTGDTVIEEWDLPVSDEGVRFIYDRNNKLGLRNGLRNWGRDEAMEILAQAVRESTSALAPIIQQVEDGAGGGAA